MRWKGSCLKGLVGRSVVTVECMLFISQDMCVYMFLYM